MKIKVYTQSGSQKGDVDMPSGLIVDSPNEDLLHLAIVRQNGNGRKNIAKVKTRAMVRGGGRKPFKQKGTGRARQGTIRAPQMRGGGVVFGPTGEENYLKSMPKKMRRKALFSALTVRLQNEQIAALESFELEKPSTKEFVKIYESLGSPRKILVVSDKKDFVLEKSVSNIPGSRCVMSAYLNPVDIMNADCVLFLESGLEKAEEIFAA